MASPKVISKQTTARDELAARIEQARRPEFIQRYIYGSLPKDSGATLADAEGARMTIIQNDGTGAATVEYDLGAEMGKVFAKLYASDGTGAAHGEHSHQVLTALWQDGFGANSRYQVSEPLGYFPEHNMLLIRGARGRLVAAADTEEELADLTREAARWLVRMHKTAVRIGEPRYPMEVYHKLMHRIAKAAAAHPEQVDELVEMSDRFEEIAMRVRPQFVQVHGQFRHIHVFVGDQAVTVIDLDRSKPADPAKDLGEYIHRMRAKKFKATDGASRADLATEAFLQEYGAHAPENLANLPLYWCYHTLVSLWRMMKSRTPGDPEWNQMSEFYLSEFERAANYRYQG